MTAKRKTLLEDVEKAVRDEIAYPLPDSATRIILAIRRAFAKHSKKGRR